MQQILKLLLFFVFFHHINAQYGDCYDALNRKNYTCLDLGTQLSSTLELVFFIILCSVVIISCVLLTIFICILRRQRNTQRQGRTNQPELSGQNNISFISNECFSNYPLPPSQIYSGIDCDTCNRDILCCACGGSLAHPLPMAPGGSINVDDLAPLPTYEQLQELEAQVKYTQRNNGDMAI